MARGRGRGRPPKGGGDGGKNTGTGPIANPAARFERTVQNRPGGPRQGRPRGRRITAASIYADKVAPLPTKDRSEGWTPLERFMHRRNRFIALLPDKVSKADKQLSLVLNLSDRETYEFSPKEAKLIVAHFRTWVDAIEKSFEVRKPLSPINLPAIEFVERYRPATLDPPPLTKEEAAAIDLAALKEWGLVDPDLIEE